MNKDRVIKYLALTKLELGHSYHLDYIMDELDIDPRQVEQLRDLLQFLVDMEILIFTEEVEVDECGMSTDRYGLLGTKSTVKNGQWIGVV